MAASTLELQDSCPYSNMPFCGEVNNMSLHKTHKMIISEYVIKQTFTLSQQLAARAN